MQHMEIEYMEWLDIIEFTVLFTLKYLFINVLMEKGVIFLSYSLLTTDYIAPKTSRYFTNTIQQYYAII